ncbi:MAG: nucleoid-structuring protein H-NS, partial [Candidatus Omnitrophota bacterium]
MFREKIKLLDCTIRDGGLMNNHNFTHEFVRAVYKAISEAGIDYMEIGYKNSRKLFSPKDYGKWKFCDEDDIKRAIDGIPSSTKISVMVDVDRVDFDDVPEKKNSIVSMVRVASYVKDIDKAIFLVNHFADKGYETTVNIM